MSEHKSPRHWRCYLTDMIEFCEKILYCTSGIRNQASFLADERTYDPWI